MSGDGHILASEEGDLEEVSFKGSQYGADALKPALVLKQMKENKMMSRKSNQDGYESSESTSVRSATVESVSKKIASTYGIKKCALLVFVCFTSLTTPN